MLKKLLSKTVVVAVLLMLGLSFITAKYLDKEEILRFTREREQLQQDRLKEFVTMLKQNIGLEKQIVVLEEEKLNEWTV